MADLLSALDDEATRAIAYAHDEARGLGHNFVGPGHIIVGLARVHGRAAEVLRSSGIDEAALRDRLVTTFGRGDGPSEHVFFTPRGRLIVEFAVDEARRRGAERTAPEHLLLGICRDGGSEAGVMLHALGTTPEQIRERLLSPPGG
jgi:ATP-dependent Clp protease ATP-binding subunit ClpC